MNPDFKKAKSIVECSKRDINFTLSIRLTPESFSTIVRNIYESFRMLGDALLIVRGIKSMDHIEQIRELQKLNVNAKRPLLALDNLRSLRHSINYQGYYPNLKEVEDALNIAKELYKPILRVVELIIKNK